MAWLSTSDPSASLHLEMDESLDRRDEPLAAAPFERALFATDGRAVLLRVEGDATADDVRVAPADACANVALPSADEVVHEGGFTWGDEWANPYASGLDVSFAFTAPAAGSYRIEEDRTGSSRAFMVRDGHCQRGVALWGPGGDPGAFVELAAGQRVVFVLTQIDAASPTFRVRVSKP